MVNDAEPGVDPRAGRPPRPGRVKLCTNSAAQLNNARPAVGAPGPAE
ncbi:hypothetical protein [Tessaracoccus sp. ZS01]|nr:hypothetical protein [Tessaracoccus sp. ZS01]